jgi:hypothetical protein
MENETGVEPSLNDQEIHDYLKEVIREIKRYNERFNTHDS